MSCCFAALEQALFGEQNHAAAHRSNKLTSYHFIEFQRSTASTHNESSPKSAGGAAIIEFDLESAKG